jgi:hypothetical protein
MGRESRINYTRRINRINRHKAVLHRAMPLIVFVLMLLSLLVAGVVTANAQTGGCASPLCAWLDVPSLKSTVDGQTLYFEGWSHNCNTGRRAESIILARTTTDGKETAYVPVWIEVVYRPDVRAAFKGCGGDIYTHLGFRLVPKRPEPPGQFIYSILVTDLPYSLQGIGMTIPLKVR